MNFYRNVFLIITILLFGCSKDPEIGLIYLDTNGVTIKCDDTGMVGDTFTVKGITYTIVDEDMLREMVNQGADVTKVCTSKITDMSELLLWNPQFNQDISAWDVSNVTNMYRMFEESWFNQDISSWDVGNVTNMNQMFQGSKFSRDISSWDVSKVTTMRQMFLDTRFNRDISSWDVSNVTNMDVLFHDSLFNQDIGSWDVSNVTKMYGMFWFSTFNQDISAWDVSNVTHMSKMFRESSFNQDLSGWNVDNVNDCWTFSYDTPQWILPKPNFTNCDPLY